MCINLTSKYKNVFQYVTENIGFIYFILHYSYIFSINERINVKKIYLDCNFIICSLIHDFMAYFISKKLFIPGESHMKALNIKYYLIIFCGCYSFFFSSFIALKCPQGVPKILANISDTFIVQLLQSMRINYLILQFSLR